MKTTKVVETSVSKLAINLIQSQRDFLRNCSEHGIKVTTEMEMSYESGFGAALIVLGITGEDAMRVGEMSAEMKNKLKQLRRTAEGKADCDCPDCNPKSK